MEAILRSGLLGNIQTFDFRDGGVFNWPLASNATFRRATQGGVLFDTGGHVLDAVLSWLGPFREVVYSDDRRDGVDANCLLELTLESGVRGVVEMSRTRNLRGTCIIRGERAEIEIGVLPRGPVTLRLGGVQLAATPSMADPGRTAPLDNNRALLFEAARLQVEEFASAACSGGDSPLFAEHRLETVRLFDACQQSRRQLDLPWESFDAPFDFEQLAGRRILVLGGAGFVGSRLVAVLSEHFPGSVRVLARSYARLASLSRFDVDVVVGDAGDREALIRAMTGCDVVINCTFGRGSRAESERVNVEAVRLMVEAAAEAGVGRMVHVSTVSAYGLPPDGVLTEDSPHHAEPSQIYGYTKWQGERASLAEAQKRGLDLRILQPTVIYGPGSAVWTVNTLRLLSTGRVPLVNGGTGLCNGVYVDDVVLALLCAATSSQGQGERFLVSGPAPVTWREFYAGYEQMLGIASTVSLSLEEVLARSREAIRQAGNLAHLRRLASDEILIKRLLSLPAVKSVKERTSRRVVEKLKGAVFSPAARSQGPAEKPVNVLDPYDAQFQSRRHEVSIEKARRLLGYEPRFDFARGLQRTAQWARWANLLG